MWVVELGCCYLGIKKWKATEANAARCLLKSDDLVSIVRGLCIFLPETLCGFLGHCRARLFCISGFRAGTCCNQMLGQCVPFSSEQGDFIGSGASVFRFRYTAPWKIEFSKFLFGWQRRDLPDPILLPGCRLVQVVEG